MNLTIPSPIVLPLGGAPGLYHAVRIPGPGRGPVGLGKFKLLLVASQAWASHGVIVGISIIFSKTDSGLGQGSSSGRPVAGAGPPGLVGPPPHNNPYQNPNENVAWSAK